MHLKGALGQERRILEKKTMHQQVIQVENGRQS